MGNIVDAVQVPGSALVKHVLALSTLDLQRLVAVEQLTRFSKWPRREIDQSKADPLPNCVAVKNSPDVLISQLHRVRLGHLLLGLVHSL